MKTRALIAAFALSAIVLGSGVSAFAYNGYHNYGNHAGMYAVSPENQGAYDAMMKDYYSRVSPIQDKLNAKGIELDALSRNPNAKPETISKLANEVAELRSQLRAERMTLGDKMEKELGIQPCRGMMATAWHHNGGRHGGGHGGHGGRRQLRFQLQLLALSARGRFLPRATHLIRYKARRPHGAVLRLPQQPETYAASRFTITPNVSSTTSLPHRDRGDCLPRSRCFVQGSLREGKG
ncbi:MAG: periplasmic heavy metal sensor [Bilophila wadsworthia]